MQRTVVINVVGLTSRLIGPHTPHLQALVEKQGLYRVDPLFPAVTCPVQATYLTGRMPRDHGIVANGWYDRDYAEHRFWKQSNHLVQGEKIWHELQRLDPDFTCAQLFWWFNMYADVDYSLTPRPLYLSDGRKVFDVHSAPFGIRDKIKKDLGPFPFQHFWGPASDIQSSAWIAESAKWIEDKYWPSLSLVYIPHLDYNGQRHGPNSPEMREDMVAVDELLGGLLAFYEKRGVEVVILSEYGLTEVNQPVYLNRLFREQGWLAIKDELGKDSIDLGQSRVFAICDHQAAHVYLNDASLEDEVRALLENTDGVAEVMSGSQKYYAAMDHERAGDFVVMSKPNAWFAYYFWMEDKRAPDYARCVDIHRKCGYDPVELFLNPNMVMPELRVGMKLARKKMGMRMLMDVVPLDATLVKGSHGHLPGDPEDWPILLGNIKNAPGNHVIQARDVYRHLVELCSGGSGYFAPNLL